MAKYKHSTLTESSKRHLAKIEELKANRAAIPDGDKKEAQVRFINDQILYHTRLIYVAEKLTVEPHNAGEAQ